MSEIEKGVEEPAPKSIIERVRELRHGVNNTRAVANALINAVDEIQKVLKISPRSSEAEHPATTVGEVTGSSPVAGSNLTSK